MLREWAQREWEWKRKESSILSYLHLGLRPNKCEIMAIGPSGSKLLWRRVSDNVVLTASGGKENPRTPLSSSFIPEVNLLSLKLKVILLELLRSNHISFFLFLIWEKTNPLSEEPDAGLRDHDLSQSQALNGLEPPRHPQKQALKIFFYAFFQESLHLQAYITCF